MIESKFVKRIFNEIASNYDKLNDVITFGLQKKIKRQFVKSLSLSNNAKILDLCTGTADIAILLAQTNPEAFITGVDFSAEMLAVAQKKIEKYKNINLIQVDALNLPFEDGSYDAVIISFGLRNLENLEQGLLEAKRVLKSGGVFANLDLGKPKGSLKSVVEFYLSFIVPITAYFYQGTFKQYKHLSISNRQFPAQNELTRILKEIGFVDIARKDYLFESISSQIGYKI